MSPKDLSEARGLTAFIDAAPSPFHACAEGARRLEEHGFRPLDERSDWGPATGRRYVLRGGCLVAWAAPEDLPAHAPFRVLAGHSDSPNLRIKPRPDNGRAGCRQLGVEVYGGVLLSSWLDRELGLSGRVAVRGAAGVETRLLLVNRPILRLPQLAIHLDREVNTRGLVLDMQKHMAPIWALGAPEERGFASFLASELDVDDEDVLGWDVMCHVVTPSTIWGRDDEFVAAPRLDNLCSCYAAMRALVETVGRDEPAGHVPVIAFFDHEEVGSGSARGAASPVLGDVLERIVLGRGGDRSDVHRAVAGSFCVSADMAHATHPNYVDKHEPGHLVALNAGPVIKINTNMKYATDAEGEALFQTACEQADVPFQKWVNRSDLACGSTIGPITAARLGLRTVDVGVPQLAMHSSRETCGSADPAYFVRALTAYLGL